MSDKKILIVIHKADLTGGVGYCILAEFTILKNAGYDLIYLASDKGELTEKLSSLGAKIHYIKYQEISKSNPWPYLLLVIKTIRFLLNLKIKLVYSHFHRYRDPILLASKIVRIKSIIFFHGPFINARNQWFHLANYAIFNSNFTKQKSDSEYWKQNSSLIFYPLDQREISIPQKKTSNITPKILNVSRLHPSKSLETFIQIAGLISKKIAAEFYIIGNIQDPEYYQSLLNLVSQEQLSDKIKFIGHIENVQNEYHKYDLMIHTAKDEPFGRIYLEAALAKLPVVACFPGGIQEVIVDREDALVFQYGEIDYAAQLTIEILNDLELEKKLTNNFYSKVIDRFAPERYADSIVKVIDRIIC